jgi:hypothetical protein
VKSESVDLDALPLRFNPPDGWRTPDPKWISLYQGFEPPAGWRPYPQAPAIPPSWPWWEENGTSWFRFFRDRPPIPTRALGNWFSLAALGLFMFAVSPFALPGWWVAAGGVAALVLIVLGVRGVVRTYKTQSGTPLEPLASIREWATQRREGYFLESYLAFRHSSPRELTLEEFVDETLRGWWGENPGAAESL